MSALPLDHWTASLDQMEASLNGSLKALDRSSERWELAAAPSAGEGEEPRTLDRLGSRLQEWESRLSDAEALTANVEAELADRAAAVERWRAVFASWAELLERQPVAATAS